MPGHASSSSRPRPTPGSPHASPADIDRAVTLGLGYRSGPLAMGDTLGPARVLGLLAGLQSFYGDPRYRPSPWLKRRAMLGASLLAED